MVEGGSRGRDGDDYQSLDDDVGDDGVSERAAEGRVEYSWTIGSLNEHSRRRMQCAFSLNAHVVTNNARVSSARRRFLSSMSPKNPSVETATICEHEWSYAHLEM